MAKLKVTERDLRRVHRKPAIKKQGINFFGVLGWLCAVASAIFLSVLIIGGQRQRQAQQAALTNRFVTAKQDLDSRYADFAKRADAVVDEVKAVDKRDREEFADVRKLAQREKALADQVERATAEVTAYQRQFSLARQRLGFPYETIEAMTADYQRLDGIIQAAIEADNKREALAEAARREREARGAENSRQAEQADESPKPEAKMFDLKMETTKFRSKDLVACSAVVKNGDFDHDYELAYTIVFYGVSTSNKHVFRVLRRLDDTFTINKRQELPICNVQIPMSWDFAFDNSYEFDGMVVAIKDTEGNILLGRTMLTSQAKFLASYAALKEGDHFDSGLRPIIMSKKGK